VIIPNVYFPYPFHITLRVAQHYHPLLNTLNIIYNSITKT